MKAEKHETAGRIAERPLIFFSYSRADLQRVLRIAREVRLLGLATWIDVENLQPGQTWRLAIRAALSNADVFVSCISTYSLESIWIGEELSIAENAAVPILPLMLDHVAIERLPLVLRERQILDATQTITDEPDLIAKKIQIFGCGQSGKGLQETFLPNGCLRLSIERDRVSCGENSAVFDGKRLETLLSRARLAATIEVGLERNAEIAIAASLIGALVSHVEAHNIRCVLKGERFDGLRSAIRNLGVCCLTESALPTQSAAMRKSDISNI